MINSDTRSATSTDYSTFVNTTKGETNIGIVYSIWNALEKEKAGAVRRQADDLGLQPGDTQKRELEIL